ncbi:MAG: TraB/GumN family protein [Porphyromonadaceae bacterium]|nr:MAG: TraB/GumN family protein [Porphyromonadaceae bacterium]
MFALTCQAQLLWKVSGGTLEKPSYLFGTYHLMPSAFVDSVPGLNDAIKKMWMPCGWRWKNSQMTAPATVMKMSKMMIAPPDSTIDALLSKDAYQIVDTMVQRYLGTFGINLDKLKTMRPAALSTQLAQLMAVQRLPDIEMNNLIDGEVERRVKALGKPAHSLETVDFQLQLLLGDPLPKQAADLLEMCKKTSARWSAISMICTTPMPHRISTN